MMILKKYLFALVFIFTAIAAANANAQVQKVSHEKPVGTEFWVTFMQNYKNVSDNAENEIQLQLFITGDEDANVKIEIPAIGFNQSEFVPGGTVKNIIIAPEAQVISTEVIETDYAVHVTSDKPVSVYGLNRRKQTTDTYLALPTNVLGKEYRVMCYHVSEKLSPIFSIVATEDNTEIEVELTADSYFGKKKGEPFVLTMNRGDVYQIRSRIKHMNDKSADLTGSYIKSNKKIAVFSGHECSYVPAGPPKIIACNHLVEQIPPIKAWGRHFYVGKLQGRSQYTYRVLAQEDETKIFENSVLVKTLKAGEFMENNSGDNLQLSSDKPILVAQFSQGFNNGDSIGDPMMLLISPTQQFLDQYRFATPVNGKWNHYVSLIVPTRAISSLVLNNNTIIDSTRFEKLGLSRYSIANVKVPFGTHYLRAREPFGLYSYGFGYGLGDDAYDAYGTMGGQSLLEYEDVIDSLPPQAELSEAEVLPRVILRDDRVNDFGLKSFTVIDSIGLNAQDIDFSEGSPQAAFGVVPADPLRAGSLIFEVSDVSDNKSIFTICYSADRKTGEFGFTISEGINDECIIKPGLMLGAFGKISWLAHNADFSSTGNFAVPGTFGNANGTAGFGGLYVGYPFDPFLTFSGRLSVENIGGEITARDSVLSSIRDPETGELLPFQEEYSISLADPVVELSFAAEYKISKYLYLAGGVDFSILTGKNADLKRRILIPGNYVYDNGQNEIDIEGPPELESLNSFRAGLFGGVGSLIKILPRWFVNIEGTYTYRFGALADDADWDFNKFSLFVGLRYQFDSYER